MAAFKAALAVCAGLALASCALLDEPRRYHAQQEWAQLRNFNVGEFTEKTIGLHPSSTVPLARRTWACKSLPLERRTTVQEGVVDAANYTQCWRQPYYNSGQRMGNRPEPQS